MDKAAIYRKTEKGLAEITATERSVDRRLRPLLILVDGERTATRVHALISGIGIQEQDFDELLAGGYIEMVPRPGAAAPGSVQEAPAPNPVLGQRRTRRLSVFPTASATCAKRPPTSWA